MRVERALKLRTATFYPYEVNGLFVAKFSDENLQMSTLFKASRHASVFVGGGLDASEFVGGALRSQSLEVFKGKKGNFIPPVAIISAYF